MPVIGYKENKDDDDDDDDDDSWQEVHIMKLHSAFSDSCWFLSLSSTCSS
jgi:hypothetical protein